MNHCSIQRGGVNYYMLNVTRPSGPDIVATTESIQIHPNIKDSINIAFTTRTFLVVSGISRVSGLI